MLTIVLWQYPLENYDCGDWLLLLAPVHALILSHFCSSGVHNTHHSKRRPIVVWVAASSPDPPFLPPCFYFLTWNSASSSLSLTFTDVAVTFRLQLLLSLLWNMSGNWWWRSINQEVDHVLPLRRGHVRCLYNFAQTWKSHATTRGDRIGQHFPWALLKTRSQLMVNCFRYVVAAMTLGEKWQRGWGSWYVVKTQVKLILTGKDCQLRKGQFCLSKMVQKEHFKSKPGPGSIDITGPPALLSLQIHIVYFAAMT